MFKLHNNDTRNLDGEAGTKKMEQEIQDMYSHSNSHSNSQSDSHLKEAIAIVKSRLPYYDNYVNFLEKDSSKERHGACPFCGGEDRFRVIIENGRWYCRHCSLDKAHGGGDIIDFHKKLQNKTWFELVKEYAPECIVDGKLHAPKKSPDINNLAGEEKIKSHHQQKPIRSLKDFFENQCLDNTPGRVYELLCKHRKLSKETIEPLIKDKLFKTKIHNSLPSVMIPFFTLQGNDIYAVQALSVNQEPFPFTIKNNNPNNKVFVKDSKASKECFFILGAPITSAKKLIICESVINALTVYECFPDACCLALGSSTYTKKIKALNPYLDGLDDIIVCGDNDDAGRNMTEKILAEIEDKEKVYSIQWNVDDLVGYDVNNLLKEGKKERIMDLIAGAKKMECGQSNKTGFDIEQEIENIELQLKKSTTPEQIGAYSFQLQKLQFDYAKKIFPTCDVPWWALPEKLSRSLKQLAISCATDPKHLLGSIFAIMGASVGRHINVRVKQSWSEPLIFWTMSILESGDGKTPALNLLCEVLEERQKLMDTIYKKELKKFKELGDDRLIPEPHKPGGFFTTDFTIEGIYPDQRPCGGCLLKNDEATAFFDLQGQYKSGKGTDRQQMLRSYDGKSIRKVRASRTLYIEGLRLNITGGTQPEPFEKALQGDGEIFRSDGTLFRFMLTYGQGFHLSTIESWGDLNQRYWEKLINNAFTFCDSQTDQDDDGEPVINTTEIWFTKQALDYFIAWQNDLKAIKRFLPYVLRGFLPKSFGWVARIAGVLKCLDEFEQGHQIKNLDIDLDYTKRAIAISMFFMRQITEIMRNITLKNPPEKIFTDQDIHLCKTLINLKSELDNGKLAIAYILKKYNGTCDQEIRLKNSRALTAILRANGLTISQQPHRANGYAGYICLIWDKKTENLLKKFSTNSTNSTSQQYQVIKCVENDFTNSTNSTNLIAQEKQSLKNVENVENEKSISTLEEPVITRVVENVENVEKLFQEKSEDDDVVII